MSDDISGGWFVIALVFLILAATSLLVGTFERVKIEYREKGYKEGQIDALTGTIKYRLVTNDLKEVSWQKIEIDESK